MDKQNVELSDTGGITKKSKLVLAKSGKNIFPFILNGVMMWFVVFVLAEVIISGGRYEKDLYLFITLLIVTLAMLVCAWIKRKTDGVISSIVRGFATALPFALLDYLAVNLLLEKNSYSIYKFWGYYAIYGLILIFPITAFLIERYVFKKLSSIDKP